MSLLKETAATVLGGENLLINGLYNNPSFFGSQNLMGYRVLTGALLPREQNNNYLVLDNRTGQPIKFPENSAIFQVYIVPTVPLESANLDNVTMDLTMWNNVDFQDYYYPLYDGTRIFTGTQANSRVFLQADDGEELNGYIGYPYIGVTVANEDITAGVLQVYIYYVTALTPPVV